MKGVIRSIQPRISMTRSFDQRDQDYLGYTLEIEDARGIQNVRIGSAEQAQNQFRVGDAVSAEGNLIRLRQRGPETGKSPPYHGPAPPLSGYQERGCRRLSEKTYSASCSTCIWAACMKVEMIIDQWKPSHREHRTETFCFGPLSCRLYKSGPKRKVPGRRGMTYVEEDWVDEQETAHRERHE